MVTLKLTNEDAAILLYLTGWDRSIPRAVIEVEARPPKHVNPVERMDVIFRHLQRLRKKLIEKGVKDDIWFYGWSKMPPDVLRTAVQSRVVEGRMMDDDDEEEVTTHVEMAVGARARDPV